MVAAPPSERGVRYQRFFTTVLQQFKAQRSGLTSGSRVGGDSWYSFTAGRPGFSFVWSFAGRGRMRVELYIDAPDQASAKGLFDALLLRKDELTRELGIGLEWERLDARRASRLATYRTVPAVPPPDENVELQKWAVTTMVRWNDVLRPIIKQLVVVPTDGRTPSSSQTA